MTILASASNYIIPVLLFFIVVYALMKKVDVYDSFITGAADGLGVVIGIMPTLAGLMLAVGLLRSSGAMDALTSFISPLMKLVHFPAELVSLVVVKLFSSSAATSLLLDVYAQYGPDSYLGTLASIIMSCTETIFYTMSVYFLSAKVTKTRYTLAGALLATLAGIIVSTFLAGIA